MRIPRPAVPWLSGLLDVPEIAPADGLDISPGELPET